MFEGTEKLAPFYKKWYDAASKRHSTRGYRNEQLSESDREKIEKTKELLNGTLQNVRIETVYGAGQSKQAFSLIGGYGTIKDAPAFAAFIAEQNDADAYEKSGFLGEAFILEMTAAGFATCWVSGTYNKGKLEKLLSLKANETLLAVTPMGYAAEKKGPMERFTRFYSKGAQRKPIDKICRDFEKMPVWAKKCVECARIAPSAINAQPWFFEFSDGLKLRKPANNGLMQPALDLGICMLHVAIAAHVQGEIHQWEKTAFNYSFK